MMVVISTLAIGVEVLAKHFQFRSLCPEMGAGLATPHRAMHLVVTENGVRLKSARGERDFTDPVKGFVTEALDGLAGLRGFILMAKSPNCGVERIRIYRDDGEVARRDASGLFAAALKERYPLMPLKEEGFLNDDRLRENFVERVFVYDDWCRLIESQGRLTAKGLIDFHRRHKFQLLAHCQATYRTLGPLLADLKTRPLNEFPKRRQALLRWPHEAPEIACLCAGPVVTGEPIGRAWVRCETGGYQAVNKAMDDAMTTTPQQDKGGRNATGLVS